MSKIEKALEKFQNESERKAAQAATPEKPPTPPTPPTPEKPGNADRIGQNISDKKTTKRESHIMSAMEKNKTMLDCKSELNVQDVPISIEDAVPSAKRISCGNQNKEKSFPATTIDTYNVDEHIVSYYCAIDKPTWKGPVMVHFRRLQLSLANIQKNNGCKVLLFASASKGEGKSTISINSAITLCSNQNSSVALVDCDFRQPSFGRILGFSAEKGLADYLAEEVKIEDIAYDGLVPGLTIIPAGGKQSNVFELLDSQKMAALVPYLKERFDYVIIDTTPVLAFPDTAILASLVDGVVFVVNRENANKKHTKRAVEILKGCKIAGFIMNMSETETSDYYGYSSD
ncbi:MAG: CpsD/CapB family tyrosine-protein kinase [Candidatus Brocadiaceae bacterium]|nr:CpsD/CapB family tyrosine-protein kinase [Candidatus Brocadiaceae bacterium]